MDTAKFPYSELVGSLLYLSVCTRLDIAQAVGALACYVSAPTVAHWAAALMVVRFIGRNEEAGVIFRGNKELPRRGFATRTTQGTRILGGVSRPDTSSGCLGGRELVEPFAADGCSVNGGGGVLERNAGGEGGAVVRELGRSRAELRDGLDLLRQPRSKYGLLESLIHVQRLAHDQLPSLTDSMHTS